MLGREQAQSHGTCFVHGNRIVFARTVVENVKATIQQWADGLQQPPSPRPEDGQKNARYSVIFDGETLHQLTANPQGNHLQELVQLIESTATQGTVGPRVGILVTVEFQTSMKKKGAKYSVGGMVELPSWSTCVDSTSDATCAREACSGASDRCSGAACIPAAQGTECSYSIHFVSAGEETSTMPTLLLTSMGLRNLRDLASKVTSAVCDDNPAWAYCGRTTPIERLEAVMGRVHSIDEIWTPDAEKCIATDRDWSAVFACLPEDMRSHFVRSFASEEEEATSMSWFQSGLQSLGCERRDGENADTLDISDIAHKWCKLSGDAKDACLRFAAECLQTPARTQEARRQYSEVMQELFDGFRKLVRDHSHTINVRNAERRDIESAVAAVNDMKRSNLCPGPEYKRVLRIAEAALPVRQKRQSVKEALMASLRSKGTKRPRGSSSSDDEQASPRGHLSSGPPTPHAGPQEPW